MRTSFAHQYSLTFSDLLDITQTARTPGEVWEWLRAEGYDVESDDYAWKFEPVASNPNDEPEALQDR